MLLTTFAVIIYYTLLICVSLVFATMAVTSTNLFFSIFGLICVYFCAVWLLAFLQLEFLAFIILLVYMGAIAVLFIFISMSVPKFSGISDIHNTYPALSTILFLMFFFFVIIKLIIANIHSVELNFIQTDPISALFSNIEQLGIILYTSHFMLLILCGFILFIAIVCVVRILY